jgi:hypothetical protein
MVLLGSLFATILTSFATVDKRAEGASMTAVELLPTGQDQAGTMTYAFSRYVQTVGLSKG